MAPSTSSPETLLTLLKSGDEKAQQFFWLRSWEDIYAATLNVLQNAPDATEVTVDVLSDFLFDYVHRVSKGASIQSYLRIVAVRRAIRYQKKKRGNSSPPLTALIDVETK